MDIKDFLGWGGMFLKFKMVMVPKLANLLLKKWLNYTLEMSKLHDILF